MSTEERKTVEVAPGILVSEHLIRDAVEATSDPTVAAEVEHREVVKTREMEELREDIDASKVVVQEMFDRLRNPPDPTEKYVSYDAMPAPLQRVIKAYIDAAAANAELDAAIKALQASSREIVPVGT